MAGKWGVFLAVGMMAGCAGAGEGRQPPTSQPSMPSSKAVGVVQPRFTPSPMTLAELAGLVGAVCEKPSEGRKCVAGDYDVELLPACGTSDYYYGGVSEPSGALLIDKAPPEDTVRRATLGLGQIVCIQAIARAGQNPSYYYVTAVPVASIPKCKENKLCERYGDRETKWRVMRPTQKCTVDSFGKFSNGCASGWIDSSDLELFSEGI